MWNYKESFIKQARIYISGMFKLCVCSVENFLCFSIFPHFVKYCGVNVKKYVKKVFTCRGCF